jgi:hypothetical protein
MPFDGRGKVSVGDPDAVAQALRESARETVAALDHLAALFEGGAIMMTGIAAFWITLSGIDKRDLKMSTAIYMALAALPFRSLWRSL